MRKKNTVVERPQDEQLLLDNLNYAVSECIRNYQREPSVKNHNELAHHTECLALMLLKEKAMRGSVTASVELYRFNRCRPVIKDERELASARGLDREQLDAGLLQLRYKLNKSNGEDLTITNVQQAHKEGRLTDGEYQDAMKLLVLVKNAMPADGIEKQIVVQLDKEIDNVLCPDP